MNSLNTLGNRQVSSLHADLTRMENGEGGLGIQGAYDDSWTGRVRAGRSRASTTWVVVSNL